MSVGGSIGSRAATLGRRARALWLGFAVLVLACPAVLAADTWLRLSSEPGDYIGAGQNLLYTPADGTFNELSQPSEGASFRFETPDYLTEWDLVFMAPQSVPLTVGLYRDAWPTYWDLRQPGFDVSGEHRGCNTIRGSYQVKEVSYAAPGRPDAFWVVFEQHCEGQRPALRGELRFNAHVSVALTAPLGEIVEKDAALTFDVSATDVDGRHVTLTASGLPSDATFTDHGDNTGTFSWTPGFDRFGNYDVSFRADDGAGDIDESATRIVVLGTTSLYVDSEPGDPIGGGHLAFFSSAAGRFQSEQNAKAGVNADFLSLDYSDGWQFKFSAPNSVPITVGNYAGATRFPAQDPSTPGLEIVSGGMLCEVVDGSFEVKQVEYGPVTDVPSYWTTFEEYCDGSAAAVRGELRINADVPVLLKAPDLSWVGEDHPLAVDVSARSKAEAPVALGAWNLPAGASFVDNGDSTATITWTPTVGQAGRYTVGLIATNTDGAVDRSAARIRVRIKNDDFNDAIAFSTLPFQDVRDTRLATFGEGDPFDPYCAGYDGPSVWYAFHPEKAVQIQATAAQNGYASKISAFIGPEGALQEVACAPGYIRFPAFAVNTYHFMVEGGGDLTFSVVQTSPVPPRPSNDDFHDATRIVNTPFVDAVDTSGATVSRDDPKSCGGRTRTVWYAVTVAAHSLVTASTVGSDYAASISAFTGSRGALHRVGCGPTSLSFEGKKGRTYHIMVDADALDTPPVLRLAVDVRPLLDLSVNVSGSGSLDPTTGAASVAGRITCSKPAVVALHGVIRQRSSHSAPVEAPFDLSVPCDGTAAWTATAVGTPAPFAAGTASVAVDASSLDDVTGNTVHARATANTLLRAKR